MPKRTLPVGDLVVSERVMDTPGNKPYTLGVDVIYAIGPSHPAFATAYGVTIEQARDRAALIAAVPEQQDKIGKLQAERPKLLEIVRRTAKLDCRCGKGNAGCFNLPAGVVRSVCLSCKARVTIAKIEKEG